MALGLIFLRDYRVFRYWPTPVPGDLVLQLLVFDCLMIHVYTKLIASAQSAHRVLSISLATPFL